MDPDKVIETLTANYGDKQVNLLDGLKIDFDESWVHLRKSNTEPIMRIISEAPTAEAAQELVQKFKEEIKALS